jgi:predicted hydrocarbon binding protein
MEASESSGTQARPRRPAVQDASAAEAPARDAEVAAFLPLALLYSVRSHDRPEEVLEDENLTRSLPRRLGLSDVIHTQIRRYEEATRKGRTVPARELVDLIRLVIRRPDAEEVLDEAGRGIVSLYLKGMGERRARVARVLPRALARSALARRARILARRIAAGAQPDVAKAPLRVSLRDSITAEVDPGGAACGLYNSTFAALAGRYFRTAPRVEHTRCSTRGDEACEWTVHE